jgi:hypothetical protein
MPLPQVPNELGEISEAITLAREVATHFIDHAISIHPMRQSLSGISNIVSAGVATIRGNLNLSHQDVETGAVASCSFCFPAMWRRWSPALRCSATWIRRPTDLNLRANWHVNSDESLCYVLDAEWRDCLADIEAKHGNELTIDAAAFYCVNNARWLLFRHLEGYRRKLNDWPRDWPEWSHNLAGLHQYASRKSRRQHLP